MSGKKRPPTTPTHQMSPPAPPPAKTPDRELPETPTTIGLVAAGPEIMEQPPAAITDPLASVIHCRDCFWGQDRRFVEEKNRRRCRGGLPHPHPTGLRVGDPNYPHARGVWTEVADDDYCKAAEPLK